MCWRPLCVVEQQFNLLFMDLSVRELLGVDGASRADEFVDFRKVEAHMKCLVANLEFTTLGA
jgi:hypothetical protein